MNRFSKLFILLSLVQLVSCSKSETGNSSKGAFSVQVTNGDGSGTFNSGDTVHVYAQTPANDQVFDKWTGDVQSLLAPDEWHSALKMPMGNIKLTATYKAAPNYTYINEVINGTNVYYYVPAGYKGLILLFHGGSSSATDWTTQRLEYMSFTKYAITNGYAVLAVDSKDRVTKTWDLSMNSADVNNIDVILNSLKTRNIIAASTKFFGVGMSTGGSFCSSISYQRSYRAAAIYCIPGVNQLYSSSKIPTIWNMSRNDVTQSLTRLSLANNNFNMLNGRGVTSEFYVNEPYPVNAGRFAIINGLTESDGAKIIDGLKAGGFIDTRGNILADVASTSAWKSSVPAAYKNSLYQIQQQLSICYTQHEFYKDSNYRTIEFFNRF